MTAKLTADAKRPVLGFNLDLALVLLAGNKAECAARGLNSDSARILVFWIVDEFVELDYRRGSHVKHGVVAKLQVRLPGAPGANRLALVNIAARRKETGDVTLCLRFYPLRLSDYALRVRARAWQRK
jgi:hypothetical protein